MLQWCCILFVAFTCTSDTREALVGSIRAGTVQGPPCACALACAAWRGVQAVGNGYRAETTLARLRTIRLFGGRRCLQRNNRVGCPGGCYCLLPCRAEIAPSSAEAVSWLKAAINASCNQRWPTVFKGSPSTCHPVKPSCVSLVIFLCFSVLVSKRALPTRSKENTMFVRAPQRLHDHSCSRCSHLCACMTLFSQLGHAVAVDADTACSMLCGLHWALWELFFL